MIRVAIVEDENNAAEILEKHLKEYANKKSIEFLITRFESGIDFISQYQPIFDIVFMDIKMPHLDGMETAKKLRTYDSKVALVFITNMIQYAIKGYEVNALDFVLKPVNYFEFEMKMTKVTEYVSRHKQKFITVELEDSLKKILLSDLEYIEVINHTLIYHMKDKFFEAYGQLKAIEKILYDENFFRCHNSYLVNLNHVMEVYQDYILVGKHKLPLSRRKRKEFMKQLADYMGGGI